MSIFLHISHVIAFIIAGYAVLRADRSIPDAKLRSRGAVLMWGMALATAYTGVIAWG